MPTIDLSAGRIAYDDSGGTGPPVVLLHGLLMDGTLWSDVVADLSNDHRCIVPTLPLGAHTTPVHPDADVTVEGLSALVLELLERLDLDDVTVVGNDTGGVLVQQLGCAADARVGRIALVSCDAFDNFPPGLTGKTLFLTGKLPAPIFGLFMQQMRLKPMRRLPLAFGWLTKRGDAVTKRWLRPILSDRGIRRDTVRVLRTLAKQKAVVADASTCMRRFDKPALVVWAADDRVMPPAHGERLAALLPQGRLVSVPDSYTLVPLDQPRALADSLRAFVAEAQT